MWITARCKSAVVRVVQVCERWGATAIQVAEYADPGHNDLRNRILKCKINIK